MFSQVSVCPQIGGGGYLSSYVLSSGGYLWYQVPSTGYVQERGWVLPCSMSFPGVGISGTRWVGMSRLDGIHPPQRWDPPAGMLSCENCFFFLL